MLHYWSSLLKKKWIGELPYRFLGMTNKPATAIPNSASHSGNGEYVVLTGTGVEVGSSVVSVVCGIVSVVTGCGVSTVCVMRGVMTGVSAGMNVTVAVWVVFPVYAALFRLL